MSQKPIDQRDPLATKQAVWELARSQTAPFTVRDIWHAVKLDESTVRDYLNQLSRGGYLQKATSVNRTISTIYTVINVGEYEAPRFNKDGQEIPYDTNQDLIWRAIWVLKNFTVADIEAHLRGERDVTTAAVNDYLKHLTKAGYIKRTLGGFRTIPTRNSGPRAPMIQRVKRIYDPNKQQVVWPPEEVNP